MTFTLKSVKTFVVNLPDENGDPLDHYEETDPAVEMPAGEYEILGTQNGFIIIADGDLESGEGCNWVLNTNKGGN